MDGQSEKIIQTVKQYLQNYLDYKQDNWVEFVLIAQFAINNLRNIITHKTLHFVNLGKHLRII